MFIRFIIQFVYFALSAIFCLYTSELTFVGLIEYQIKTPDFVCGLFTALYVLSAANIIRRKPVDRYIAFRQGTYKKWICDKELGILIYTAGFTIMFVLANLFVAFLKSIDIDVRGSVVLIVYILLLFTLRFVLLGEIMLYLSILWPKTIAAFTIVFGLSMSLDSRAIYIGDFGAVLPQYHLSSDESFMSILYFVSFTLIFCYLSHDSYLRRDAFQ